MYAALTSIEFHTPATVVGNCEVANLTSNWTPEKVLAKTGIAERHIAAKGECASDLAYHAAEKLFARIPECRDQIDFIIFCTQSPDYLLPTSACLLQDRLKLRTNIGAFDFNLGCSGYVYGLGLAQGLIETGQARQVLLLTGETYSKFLRPDDVAVRSLFGDAGSASLISAVKAPTPLMGPYEYGTDGRGAENLYLKRGSIRNQCDDSTSTAESARESSRDFLFMDGPEIFSFALETVPFAVKNLLRRANLNREEIDLYIFHQANEFMLRRLQAKLAIPDEKFVVSMRDYGNTVSSTIPIALHSALAQGQLRSGMQVLLMGFGVGYSWGAMLMRYESLVSAHA